MAALKLFFPIFLILVSCSKKDEPAPQKATQVNTLIGSNPTSTTTPSSVTSAPVKPAPPATNPTPKPTTPATPVPAGPVVVTPLPNEQQLVSAGTPISADGNWKGNCQISLNGKMQTSCYLELDIIQRPDSFCPSTFYVSTYLSQGTDPLAIANVSASLIQYASAHMGLFGNSLMSILDCEILVNFDPGHQAKRLGTVGQGGFKYKDAQGITEMKGLFVNNAWEITYKTGGYTLEAVLR